MVRPLVRLVTRFTSMIALRAVNCPSFCFIYFGVPSFDSPLSDPLPPHHLPPFIVFRLPVPPPVRQRHMLVHADRADRSDLVQDPDHQLSQVRPLRPRPGQPAGPLRQHGRLRRGGPHGQASAIRIGWTALRRCVATAGPPFWSGNPMQYGQCRAPMDLHKTQLRLGAATVARCHFS